MPQINDLVKFRGDKLFQGAIDIDWISLNRHKAEEASLSYVFHGPKYHGVVQSSIGESHGHILKDTVSFFRDILLSSKNRDSNNLTLAIAGYGAGKSHLALTLANMLKNPNSKLANEIVKNAISADKLIGEEIKLAMEERKKPSLVIALNGMQDFDLSGQFNKQLLRQLKENNIDTKPLDDLKPRFKRAKSLIMMSNTEIQQEVLKATNLKKISEVVELLEEQDEFVYSAVYEILNNAGTPIEANRGESLKDIIVVTSENYCGPKKPFSDLFIIFDEFGRYTEFATIRSQIAGSGVLQQLFEGVQATSEKTIFIGFIQYELNSYVKRIGSEYQNDIQRYITRFQSAKKTYLSSNIETLIAHLIEKNNEDHLFKACKNLQDRDFSERIRNKLGNFFPLAKSHSLWQNPQKFHEVIRTGCWPLSPFSVWLLVHLTQAGNHLQGRSALFFLSRTFESFLEKNRQIDEECLINPLDLWSDELLEEFLLSEQQNFTGGVASSYQNIYEKYSHQLEAQHLKILKAIVLINKLGMKCDKREDAIDCISEFCGSEYASAFKQAEFLQNDLSLIIWDEKFCQFELLTDSVSRNEFIGRVKKYVESRFPGESKKALFLRKANELLGNLLTKVECDFAEINEISSKEWHFTQLFANLDNLKQQVDIAINEIQYSWSHTNPRGRVIYCYIDNNTKLEKAKQAVQKLLDSYENTLPIMVVIVTDENGMILQSMAEIEVMTTVDDLINNDRYANLLKINKEKTFIQLEQLVKNSLRPRPIKKSFHHFSQWQGS